MRLSSAVTINSNLVLGALLLAPVYLAGKRFGTFYNERFRERLVRSKIVKGLKASWVLDWYFKGAL